ncbi:MAG: D-cysteine desulfhydrase [Burkholderiales bacterium]|nr:D-cysteine desulfhydrase [Burkholderiales bacterium]
MKPASINRVPLVNTPTALEPLPNLTRHLGGPELYIKRDDCTGLALGGNKTRKLEYLLADALKKGADHLITHGAVQSNHVRQTAAAAAKVGMRFTGVLEHRIADPGLDYLESGNAFLSRLLGSHLVYRPAGDDMGRAMQEVAASLLSSGEHPYIIPGGGSTPLGSLGYAQCAEELVQQAATAQLRLDYIIHPTGSGGTQAGLIAGLECVQSGTKVLGISVKAPREQQESHVHALAQATAKLMECVRDIDRKAVEVNSDYVGPGYGRADAATVEAIELVARLEGVILDPVYTGKAMAGLMDLIRLKRFSGKDTVVFLHTGGAPALFSYRELFMRQDSTSDTPRETRNQPLKNVV